MAIAMFEIELNSASMLKLMKNGNLWVRKMGSEVAPNLLNPFRDSAAANPHFVEYAVLMRDFKEIKGSTEQTAKLRPAKSFQ